MDIQIENLFKAYEGKQVLSGFSARIPAGEATCLMGPSGCGKTTLARLIMGLEKPDAGCILNVPAKISAVFQEDRLCEDFTALSNVVLPSPGKQKEAADMLARLGLGDEIATPVREMSGGMKRRVAIARALVFGGEMLLMDEGFQGLDEETKFHVLETVKAETRGRTLLLITHDEKEALALGGQILRL